MTTESASGRNLLRDLAPAALRRRRRVRRRRRPARRRGARAAGAADRRPRARRAVARSARTTSMTSENCGTSGPGSTWSTPSGPRAATCCATAATRSPPRCDALDEARAWGVAHPADVVAAAQSARTRARTASTHTYYETLNFSFDAAGARGTRALHRGVGRDRDAGGAVLDRAGGGSMSVADLLDRAAGGGRLTFDEGVRALPRGAAPRTGRRGARAPQRALSRRRRDLRDRHDDQLHERLQRPLHLLRVLPAGRTSERAGRCRTTRSSSASVGPRSKARRRS